MHQIPIEICLDCVAEDLVAQDVVAAAEGGAARVELCSNVAAGGVTPAPGLVAAARRAAPPSLQVLVMIRPRTGPFHVTEDDLSGMILAIKETAAAGAHGVVFGVTRVDSDEIDLLTTRTLVETATRLGLTTTYHRAFDSLVDPGGSLRRLIELGVDRVLTAGSPWNSGKPAVEGLGGLVRLARQAANKMEIVIGGGVDPAAVSAVVQALDPHARHFSLHAYSSVHENGRVSRQRVAELVGAVNALTQPASPGPDQ